MTDPKSLEKRLAGLLLGTAVGEDGIPDDWLRRLWEWPRTPAKMRVLAERLARAQAQGQPQPPVRYFWIAILPRNLFFFRCRSFLPLLRDANAPWPERTLFCQWDMALCK